MGATPSAGLLAIALMLGPAGSMSAQATEASAPRDPAFSLSAGLGSVLGWLGVAGEYHLPGRAMSIAGGAGYIPELAEGNPSMPAFGIGARRYLSEGRHRALIQLSVSMVSFDWTRHRGTLLDSNQYYGPGLAGGYRFTADGGFHFDLSWGAGWGIGAGRVDSVGSLAVGYTWRR